MRLGIDDVRSLAVAGDTANDLLAGWRAGAGVVAGVLTGAHGRAALEAAPHTHVLDSIADLPGVLASPDSNQPPPFCTLGRTRITARFGSHRVGLRGQ